MSLSGHQRNPQRKITSAIDELSVNNDLAMHEKSDD